jgi:hypothetical protein
MKKNSPQKSRRTSDHIPLVEPDLDPLIEEVNPDPIDADLGRLSSILPAELGKELFNESVEKSILIFLDRLGKGWAEQHQAFDKDGIDYTDIGLRLVTTGTYFIILRHFRESVGTHIGPHRQKLASYLRSASHLSGPSSPFPPPLKEGIRHHAATVLSQLDEIYLRELERYFHLPEGTSLDPSTEKSLHTQPVFMALLDDLYLHLKEKGATRPNRLLYDLWLSSGIIRSPEDCDFPSFKRQLNRRKKKRQTPLLQ